MTLIISKTLHLFNIVFDAALTLAMPPVVNKKLARAIAVAFAEQEHLKEVA